MKYDALIIGLGPAGVSAAHYLTTAGYKTLAVGKKGGALYSAEKITNFYGQEEISGATLFLNGIKHAEQLGAIVKYGEVFDVEFDGKEFSARTSVGEYTAKTVLIATGVTRNKPNIANLKDYEGKGVSYCAVCDGFFYRKRKVGVLGSGDYAFSEADYLLGIGCDVTIFTNGVDVEKNGYKICKEKIESLYGEDVLEGVSLVSSEACDLEGLFVALGSASSNDFALKMGLITDGNYIMTDDKKQTNAKGVYAAGDCTGGLLQVSKAVSDGAIAGVNMCKYLKENKSE